VVYLLFDIGYDSKYFRGFKSKKEAIDFKYFFTFSCDDLKTVKFIDKKDILDKYYEINDQVFENLIKICKREILELEL